MSTDGRRYVPKPVDGDIPAADLEYVEAYADLGAAVDAATHSEDIVLLLSTCRNVWMTVNAVFVDVKEIIGAGDTHDAMSSALYLLGRCRVAAAADPLDAIGLALDQIESKIDVWSRRADLMMELTTIVDDLGAVPRSRLRGVLARQRQPPATPHVAHGQFLALDLDTEPARLCTQLRLCGEAHARLRLVFDVSRALIPLAAAIASAAADAEEAGLALFNEDLARQREVDVRAAWPRVARAAAAARVKLSAYAGLDEPTQVAVDALDVPAAEEWLRQLTDAGRRVVTAEHEKFSGTFLRNIAIAPMPAPFVVDLSGADTRHRRHGRDFEIARVTGPISTPEDSVRIALLRCGMPEDAYSHTHPDRYVYRDAPYRDEARRVALEGIEQASDSGCVLLAMPEAFLPEEARDAAHSRADALGLALITGVEYLATQTGVAISLGSVSLPGVADIHEQRKQGPSVYELRAEDFAGDGRLWVFRNTAVGVLGVVICSDYLEFDVIAQMAGVAERLDTLIVCARNPNPAVFTRLAIADASRLYSAVVVVNCRPDKITGSGEEQTRLPSTSEGTVVALPRSANPELEATGVVALTTAWTGDEKPTLALYDLPLAAIRARDRRNPHDETFLPSPTFVRRRSPG